MAIREVKKLPHPILRKKAHKVTKFNQEFQTLVEDMIETMRVEPGVGLAAPQVNVSSRVIVVEYPMDDTIENAKPKLFIVANPEIVKTSEDNALGVEGCLSVPDVVGEVERSIKVVVKGQNRYGKKEKIRAQGWLARIFQHEIDHLNGVLFIDRAEQLWKTEEVEASKVEMV
ncbi:MAG TPA: peptide deformylase [Anaerolineae bacterium]|nr:peptide deformylase [Anaerolineae bacterium]